MPAPLPVGSLIRDSKTDAEVLHSFDAPWSAASTSLDGAVGSVAAANASSEAVDPAWYLSVYTDVAAAGMDPNEHYRTHGRIDGRFPSPRALSRTLFDFDKYFKTDP